MGKLKLQCLTEKGETTSGLINLEVPVYMMQVNAVQYLMRHESYMYNIIK